VCGEKVKIGGENIKNGCEKQTIHEGDVTGM
jgi:hypothetical protein